MPTRRRVLCGCAVFLSSPLLRSPSHAQRGSSASASSAGDDDIFVCGTDEAIYSGQFSITDYGATASDAVAVSKRIREFRITDFGTAFLSQRWQPSDGLASKDETIRIGIHFINGTPSERRHVEDAARVWLDGRLGTRIQFEFGVTANASQVRVRIGGDANNSFIGRYNARIRHERPTMNLASTSSSVCQHEFGHMLCLWHEHLNPTMPLTLKPEIVIADMRRRYKWTEVQTHENILNRLNSDAQCVGDPTFNHDSIMLYDIPADWTVEQRGYSRSKAISSRDMACLYALYGV